MKKRQRHIKTGYNRGRNAERRFLNSEIGKLFVTKFSKRVKMEILLNGWSDSGAHVNESGGSYESPGSRPQEQD
jgi:hypothetical protein